MAAHVDQRQISSSITVSLAARLAAKKAIKIDSDLLLTDTVQQAAMQPLGYLLNQLNRSHTGYY